MRFKTRLLMSGTVPVGLFVIGMILSIDGLLFTKSQFDSYIKSDQRINTDLSEVYAQGLPHLQVFRNIVLDPAAPRALDNLNGAPLEAGTAELLKQIEGVAKISEQAQAEVNQKTDRFVLIAIVLPVVAARHLVPFVSSYPVLEGTQCAV